MLVPQSLCGRSKQVAALWRRRATALARGAPWIDPDAALIDAGAAPGLILLNGASPLFGSDDNVHAYAPLWVLGHALERGRVARDVAAAAFAAALARPWSVLGALSQACYRWVDDAALADRFLAAMIRDWDALDALGARYTMGSRQGARLWDLPHVLKYVLARRGVAQADLLRPLPPGGLAALASARAAAH
jgi:hypothetical protein